MAKLTLTDVSAGYLSVATYNANNALIEAALENTVSRDGTSPNTMSADFDMNSNKVVNVTDPTNNQDAATKAYVDAQTGSSFSADSTDTLTNKTIDADNNTITNLHLGNEVTWNAIGDVTDVGAFQSGDKILVFEAGVGMRKIDYDDLPGGGGGGLSNIVEDVTPQLGGALDVNGNAINIGDGVNINWGTGTDVQQDFDGTDMRIIGSNGMLYRVMGGFDHRVYDQFNAGYCGTTNDGSHSTINSNVGYLRLQATLGVEVRTGKPLRVLDSTNIDIFSIQHDGTDVQVTNSAGELDFNDLTIREFKSKEQSYESDSNVIAANAATLTWANGPAYELDLDAATGNVTVTLSGGPASGDYGVMTVKVTQDSTDRTITWAGGTFVWQGGAQHVMQTGNDAITIYTFETWDGGTTWYATGADYS